MATIKMPIATFVAELEAALKRKDGYIMGSRGQDPKKWSKNSWWYTQYTGKQKTKALYWRENAKRVWDCNGMAEGIYEDFSGVNINTKARYNYANWCGIKGTGTVPIKYRKPGTAVFIYSASSGYITHVGYLYKPVKASEPLGDWWVIEAKGVMYGVVKTKLSERGWNRWGLMTKYFEYGTNGTTVTVKPGKLLGSRLLKNGSEGEDVKQLQEALIRLGYSCGKWGADSDFGDATEMAVEEFQNDHNLEVDGQFGPLSNEALEKALAELDKPVDTPTKVKIVGGNCWVRTAPNKETGSKLGVAKENDILLYDGQTDEHCWHLVQFNNQNGWVSGKYGMLIKE